MASSPTNEVDDHDFTFLGDDEREIVRMFVSYTPDPDDSNTPNPLDLEIPMATGEVVIYDPARHPDVLRAMVDLHSAVILQDYTLMTFLPPLNPGLMLEWWKKQVSDPCRTVFLYFDKETPQSPEELAGFVALNQPFSQTGPFRCSVEKLVVSPRFRRRGIARKLIEKLEETALKNGGTLLQLDTESGSPAESIYPKLGFIELGRIPQFGYSPKDGRLVTETFFYKQLRTPDAITLPSSS